MGSPVIHEAKTLHGEVLCTCGSQVERLVTRQGNGSKVSVLLCRHSARVIDEFRLKPSSSALQWTRAESGAWLSKCGRFSVERLGSMLPSDAVWRAIQIGTVRQETFRKLRDAKAWCAALELGDDDG